MTPPTWTDLETRFRALQTSLEPTRGWFRIDYQWGAAGEHWSVAAAASNAAKAEFDTLCTIAGDLLPTLPATAVAPEALAEPKAKYRWYLAIWHHLTPRIPDHKGFAGPNDKVGTVYSALIREAVPLSATLCLQFSTVGVAAPPVGRLVRFKQNPVGRFLWWIGEEPLRKWLGTGLLAGVLAAIPPTRHLIAALLKWILSLFS